MKSSLFMRSLLSILLCLPISSCKKAAFQTVKPSLEEQQPKPAILGEAEAVASEVLAEPKVSQWPGIDYGSTRPGNQAPLLSCRQDLIYTVGEEIDLSPCTLSDSDQDKVEWMEKAVLSCGSLSWQEGRVFGQVPEGVCRFTVKASDGKVEVVATLAIEGRLLPPPISADPTRPLVLLNHSDGAMAQFEWRMNRPFAQVLLAISSSRQDLQGWDGRQKQLRDGLVVTDFAACSPRFRSAAAGALASRTEGRCAWNLASWLHPSLPPAKAWDKRFVRLALSDGDAPWQIHLSEIRSVANVPDGMSFIDADEWPLQEFPRQRFPRCEGREEAKKFHGCRFDFAMDRYEAVAAYSRLSSFDGRPWEAIPLGMVHREHQGSVGLDPNGFASCRDFPCELDLSSRVDTQRLASQANGANFSWVASKQLCLNRSYDYELSGFVDISDLPMQSRWTLRTPKPLRKLHLITDREFMVASYQTPDSSLYCQTEKRHYAGDPNWSQCRSRFGIFDLFGNRNEMTDDLIVGESPQKLSRIALYNTEDEWQRPNPRLGNGQQSLYFVKKWDQGQDLPSEWGPQPQPEDLGFRDTLIWNAASPLPFTVMRGGGEAFYYVGQNLREAIGRFFVEGGLPMTLEQPGSAVRGDAGMRCSLVAPTSQALASHLVFVSSSLHQAELGGLSGADRICQTLAEQAGYQEEFLALLSDQNTDARSRISWQGGLRSTRGHFIAERGEDFWQLPWLMSPYYDERGEVIPSIREVWTGSRAIGSEIGYRIDAAASAQSWQSADGRLYPAVAYGRIHLDQDGSPLFQESKRFGGQFGSASSQRRILCVSRLAH